MSPLYLFELVLGLLALALILPSIAGRLRLPPAATLVLGGMLIALVPGTRPVEPDPELIMVLFLPPLLMASAYLTVWRDFKAELRPIALLAFGAVTFTTLVVGYITKLVLPTLPWAACFALGAIVSPPDAVAAKAVIRGLPLPRRLVTILEGESLVNDASGLLLYRFAVSAALTGAFSIGSAAISLVWLGTGGVALGCAVGWGVSWVMQRRKDPHEVLLLTFLTAWLTYIVAERAHCSGVLAVVSCGMLMGWRQHEVLTARVRTELRAVWRFTVTVLESLVFVLIGLSLRGVLERLGGIQPALVTAGPISLAVIAAVLATRFAWVFPVTYLQWWLSPQYRQRLQRPAPVLLVVAWAGMRGVVSLAAALALPHNFPGRDVILFATFAVIAVTVLLQGSSLAALIRWLSPLETADAKTYLGEYAARAAVSQASLRALESMPARANSEEPRHLQLIEEYRRRVHITNRVVEQGDAMNEIRHEHFGAAIEALTAGRQELIRLHRSGELHDSTLHALEAELDLEELRMRRLDGEVDE